MTRDLVVLLDGRRAGVVRRLSNGRISFAYDPDYAADPTRTPLSLSMPLSRPSFGERVVAPWLWGLLPDDRAVLRRWASHFGVGHIDPFTLLGTPVGEDCAGGVSFARPERVEALLGDAGTVEWLDEPAIEARLRRLREDGTSWLGDGDGTPFVGRFSLAGRQSKTALLSQDGRWGVPSGPIATSHILKPPIPGFADQDLVEHLSLDAARRAGLLVAHSAIRRFGEETAVVVERYDRLEVEGRRIRVHQEDLCQALSVHPDEKYQADGGPGPVDIARLLRRVVERHAETDVGRFVDALAWNWIIGGTDAHAKNYSLLLSGRSVRLARLYDVTSALPYGNPHDLRLAMQIGDTYRVVHHRDEWARLARRLSLDPVAVSTRVRELCERAPEAMSASAADPAVVTLERPMANRLADLVTARALRCARLLDGTMPAA
jgi:serine/threonine-protein kinase HipA